MPAPWLPPGMGSLFSGISQTIASVVRISDAIEEVFWSAVRATLVGSIAGCCPPGQHHASLDMSLRRAADIGLHGAFLVETHPLYRDGTDVPALEDRDGERFTTAGSPLHLRTPKSVFRIHPP